MARDGPAALRSSTPRPSRAGVARQGSGAIDHVTVEVFPSGGALLLVGGGRAAIGAAVGGGGPPLGADRQRQRQRGKAAPSRRPRGEAESETRG